MPKKKKKEHTDDPHEGRPSGLTLGDFLVPQKLPSKKNAAAVASTIDTAKVILKEENPKIAEVEKQPVVKDQPKVFFVCRTKKGGLPVKVENRSSGKKVTIVEHVLGDGKSILTVMKNKFGTGGVNHGDFIELQGDCKTKVTKYLNENKHLLKPYGATL